MALRELAPGVYRDTKTGEIGVDEGELSDFMGEVEDALEGDDDDDDDIEGDDDDDGVEGDEIGRLNAQKLARKRARLAKRRGKVNHRLDKRSSRLDRRAGKAGLGHHNEEGHVEWAKTILAEEETLAAAGPASVQIRLQHDFKAEDLTMNGSEAGAKVTTVFFGDRVIWSSSKGVPASMFAGTSFLRSFLKGQNLRAGLDIVINGSVAAAGDFAVQLVGMKPASHC